MGRELSKNHHLRRGNLVYPHILVDQRYPELVAVIADILAAKTSNTLPLVIMTNEDEMVELGIRLDKDPTSLLKLLKLYTFRIVKSEDEEIQIKKPSDLIDKVEVEFWTH